MFWLFPENGSISERTVNRALIFHTTYKILHYKKKKKNIFAIHVHCMYQNYPLALRRISHGCIDLWNALLERNNAKLYLGKWRLTGHSHYCTKQSYETRMAIWCKTIMWISYIQKWRTCMDTKTLYSETMVEPSFRRIEGSTHRGHLHVSLIQIIWTTCTMSSFSTNCADSTSRLNKMKMVVRIVFVR